MSPGEHDNPITDDDRVREHLANERTYLGWLRTGISLMGFGVVIAKLRYLFAAAALQVSTGIVHASDIGLVFTLIGLLTVSLSAWRCYAVRIQIRQKKYRSSIFLPMALSMIVIALGLGIILYLILAHE